MKADVGKWAVIVLLSVLATGCSSIRARTETPATEWKIYPGVRQDVKEMGEIFSGERPQPGWLNGLVASILIFDLPFSSVFDTFVLPYDLNRVRNPEASQVAPDTSKGSPDRESQEIEEDR
ncbi:YceK/YidQ family lipoprotein [Methylocaldum sp.]|uniref:YceK/YidQ family lipoprotein n=1 Tax=Methylocaldum sp. TaxID=1969727 RepID=UPI002D58F3AC|nr:YceK/YidQ family lipoprotein [Methylocaldum sp.]HYE34050.1 YceK/YidQ family lipoprotein [Methylocaldum sp.]